MSSCVCKVSITTFHGVGAKRTTTTEEWSVSLIIQSAREGFIFLQCNTTHISHNNKKSLEAKLLVFGICYCELVESWTKRKKSNFEFWIWPVREIRNLKNYPRTLLRHTGSKLLEYLYRGERSQEINGRHLPSWRISSTLYRKIHSKHWKGLKTQAQ